MPSETALRLAREIHQPNCVVMNPFTHAAEIIDRVLAALTAERDRLRAEVEQLRDSLPLNDNRTRNEAAQLLGLAVNIHSGAGTYADPLQSQWYYHAKKTREVVEGLLAENECLRADAERWRWGADVRRQFPSSIWISGDNPREYGWRYPEQKIEHRSAREALDAAMADVREYPPLVEIPVEVLDGEEGT